MAEEISTDAGFSFETRRSLIEASKKLAGSTGMDIVLYQNLLGEIGKMFAQSMGVRCDVQLLVDKDEVEQALNRASAKEV